MKKYNTSQRRIQRMQNWKTIHSTDTKSPIIAADIHFSPYMINLAFDRRSQNPTFHMKCQSANLATATWPRGHYSLFSASKKDILGRVNVFKFQSPPRKSTEYEHEKGFSGLVDDDFFTPIFVLFQV